MLRTKVAPAAPLIVALLLVASPSLGAECASPPQAATVVVELFTSQGCSSCPPADELLRRIGHERGVLALSFHVDYWNRLGWEDPFSDGRWSERQESYARAFGTNRVYTPMMVIDGRRDLVGSRAIEVREAIAQRRSAPTTAELLVETAVAAGTVEVRVRITPVHKLASKTDVVLLVYENGHSTRVTRGENARRTLRNDFVVRERLVEPLREGEMVFHQKLAQDWEPDALGVAVLLQEHDSRHILAARAVALRCGGEVP